MFEVYKPSGGFGVSTFLYLLISFVPAAVWAFVYAYGLHYIPYVILGFFLAGLFGKGIGVLGTVVIKWGHCRNPLLAGFVAVVLCVFGLTAKHYVQYGLWLTKEADAILKLEIKKGTIKPADAEVARKEIRIWIAKKVSFLGHFQERAEEGFTIDRKPITRGLIYLVWAIELGVVLVSCLSFLFSPVRAARKPYSEQLGMWANETEEALHLPISSNEMVEQIKSATSVGELMAIPIPKADNPKLFASYRVHSVPGVEMEGAYLSVSLCEISLDDEGNEKKNESELVNYAILTADQRVQLLENASLMKEALADYRRAMVEGSLADDEEDEA